DPAPVAGRAPAAPAAPATEGDERPGTHVAGGAGPGLGRQARPGGRRGAQSSAAAATTGAPAAASGAAAAAIRNPVGPANDATPGRRPAMNAVPEGQAAAAPET